LINITPSLAVEALRHYVQDHGDQHTNLGKPRDQKTAEWTAGLVQVALPPSYLKVLEKHDGLTYELFSLMTSLEVYANFRDRWGMPHRYWPVAGDGCGNYYVLAMDKIGASGESPVGFIETMESATEPAYWAASSYAHFVFFLSTRHCAEKGCSKFITYPSTIAWPFDPTFVLSIDPDLERIQPKAGWPS